MKKIVIIGGGITACVLAIFLKEKKYEVEIYEKSYQLGGILNDYNFDNSKIFFKGIQYFDIENKWFEKIKKFFFRDFEIFKHIYGSYTEILKEKNFTFKFAAPIFKKIYLKNLPSIKELKLNKKKTMYDRFSFYSPREKKFLLNIIKRHRLNPNLLNFVSPLSLQMDRIAYLQSTKEISNLKKKYILDDFYALERARIFKEELYASLPKKGFTIFFKKFEKLLKKKKIKIFLNAKVEPSWNKNNLKIKFNKKNISNDHIIWTGDPSKLIHEYSKKKLDSMYTRFIQVHSNIESKFQNNIYIQVFSDKSNISRIYLYNIDKIKKISLECIVHPVNAREILYEAKEILKNFKIFIKLDENTIRQKIDTRFNILSIKDEKIIENFLKKTKNSNLINGAWQHYARDKKIHFYLEKLKEKNII